MTPAEQMLRALNRLCRWRTILAGWQLGTRPDTDPETQAVRDHREATLALRAEVSAVVNLLIMKGVCTQDEYMEQVAGEADYYNRQLEEKFPGAKASDSGMEIDVAQAREWMSKFPE